MKGFFAAAVMAACVCAAPLPATAEVNVNIGIGLPPPIVFPAPPSMVVLPDTNYVYVAPGLDVDIYFWDGWWWRLWDGRWYRSRHHNRGWGYYSRTPRFYYDVDPGWRRYYHSRAWRGHRWDYRPIPHQRLQRNWKGWRDSRHWDRRGRTWDVRDYRPPAPGQRRELRRQHQELYRQQPAVRRPQPSAERRHGAPVPQHQPRHQAVPPRMERPDVRQGPPPRSM